jgi:hypothetical protein
VLADPEAPFSQRIIEIAGRLAPMLALEIKGGPQWLLQ